MLDINTIVNALVNTFAMAFVAGLAGTFWWLFKRWVKKTDPPPPVADDVELVEDVVTGDDCKDCRRRSEKESKAFEDRVIQYIGDVKKEMRSGFEEMRGYFINHIEKGK